VPDIVTLVSSWRYTKMWTWDLVYEFISDCQHSCRDGEPQCFRGAQIESQLEFGWTYDMQVRDVGALGDATGENPHLVVR
jgi:hypothetical protein